MIKKHVGHANKHPTLSLSLSILPSFSLSPQFTLPSSHPLGRTNLPLATASIVMTSREHTDNPVMAL